MQDTFGSFGIDVRLISNDGVPTPLAPVACARCRASGIALLRLVKTDGIEPK